MDPVIIETRHMEYCSEASDLNWPVGKWPTMFRAIGHTWEFIRRVEAHGELVAMKYRSLNTGAVLTVWND